MIRILSLAALVLVTAPLTSCATLGGGGGGAQFADVAALTASSTIPADAPAVVLLREESIYVRAVRGKTEPITEHRGHEVIKVLSEAGFEAAKMRVVIPPDGELVELGARTVAPDGKVTIVDPKSMQATRTVIEGSAGVELRFFQFPKVEVGSILELVTMTRTRSFFFSWAGDAASPFPIANYHAEFSTPANVTFDLLLNGSQAQMEKIPDDSGREHVVLTLKDVPAVTDEIFAPGKRTGAPWWIYRVTEIRSASQGDFPGVVAWDRAIPGNVTDLVAAGEKVQGFSTLDAASCNGEVRCVANKALAQARAKEWSGFSEEMEVRDPEEIEASGTANNMEKALFLWSTLRSANVEAYLAFLSRSPGFPVNKTFPSAAWFDHAVVFVPGLGELFLDPSCEACAIGQIPEWDRGVEALVAKPKSNHYEIVTEWKAVKGDPLPSNEHKITYDARVAANGDVEVDVTDTATGETAAFVRLETRLEDAAEVQHGWDDFAKDRSRGAKVVSSTPWSCDRAQASCKRTAKIAIPAFATPDGNRLLVPLELFYSNLESAIPADMDVKQRKADVEIGYDTRILEELHLHAPAGFVFEAAPEVVDHKAEFGAATMQGSAVSPDEMVVTRQMTLSQTSMTKGGFAALVRLVGSYGGARSQTVKMVAKK